MPGLDTINNDNDAIPLLSSRGQETTPLLLSAPSQAPDDTPKYRSNSFDQNHGRAYSDASAHRAANKHTDESGRHVSYWGLLRDNANFRLYLMGYLVTCAGEWFTYVASISAIEQIHASNNITSRTSISILVSLRLLPNALFTPIGGVLADSYDRRTILLVLDLLGSLVALLFLLAYHMKSITALYMATALQMTVAAIYEPSQSALISMLVTDEESLKYAITMSELAWSVMTALGSSMGGFAAESFGISTCFVIDSLSYLISALFIWKINGTYFATTSKPESTSGHSNCNKEEESFSYMFTEGLNYLISKPWGPFVLLKFCAALVYGAGDVLNVSYSERVYADSIEGSNQRLGVLFTFVGVGCFLGPVIVDHFTSMDQVASLERACLGSFLLMGVGCFGLYNAKSFLWVCIYTSVRAAGSNIVWIHSSLLLQKFSNESMLGRVMSVDYALATLSEAVSAMGGGMLQDHAGLTAEQVSFLMSMLALFTLAAWVIYLAVVRV